MNIYEKHQKAFAYVRAYAILANDEKIATVSLKYPKDGAGRLTCFFHVLGYEMVSAYAAGYGYDKTTAAISYAAKKFIKQNDSIDIRSRGLASILAKMDSGNIESDLYDSPYKLVSVL
jgi:hypothetical protein